MVLHKPKAEDTNQENLSLLHMDLCGPMRVESINEKKYILTLRGFYENVSISHQTSVARTPQHNSIVERRNQTLMKAARIMLIFSKAPLFLWAEAINTACYTQNCSLIRIRYSKTPYELMHEKKPDLSFFHVFGSLCYPTNDSEDLGKLNAKADIVPVATAPRAVEIVNLHVSTSIDEDASSSSIPLTQEQEHSSIISQNINESPKTPLFHDDPLYEFIYEDSNSQGSSSNMRPSHTQFEIIGLWTKDYPIENVIGDPSRSIYKVKTDEFGRVLKDKARLVSQEFRKEEGIDFEESFTWVARIEDIYIPMVENNNLDKDLQETPVDATLYRGMIRSLMYLTSSRLDLIYAVCLCAWYQAKPTEKHLNAVKWIFRYLKGTINMRL
nr:retrovirus-related Pol polyprotein from transposon TNT 1-94 [Tanacetum cinerariifolium]